MIDLGVDLGGFGALVVPCADVPPGEIWSGPMDADPSAAFGPGTTAGGRAEAGWVMLGRIAD